jgi:ferredoxin--NADP+ reductase
MILEVTEIQHYTDTLFRIRTERPTSYRFTAGEFVMLSMEDAPKRAYSLTSGPYDDYLEFYSIKVPDGPLTSKLQHVKIGDQLDVGNKPTGTLTLANLELGGNLWLLATGTGIAPFISLLRDPTTYDAFDKINLVWSVSKAEQLQAYDSFLQEQSINYLATVTQDSTWVNENRRITELIKAGSIMKELDPAIHKVMICGSMPFNNSVKELLTEWGWDEGNRNQAGTFVQEKAFVG